MLMMRAGRAAPDDLQTRTVHLMLMMRASCGTSGTAFAADANDACCRGYVQTKTVKLTLMMSRSS